MLYLVNIHWRRIPACHCASGRPGKDRGEVRIEAGEDRGEGLWCVYAERTIMSSWPEFAITLAWSGSRKLAGAAWARWWGCACHFRCDVALAGGSEGTQR